MSNTYNMKKTIPAFAVAIGAGWGLSYLVTEAFKQVHCDTKTSSDLGIFAGCTMGAIILFAVEAINTLCQRHRNQQLPLEEALINARPSTPRSLSEQQIMVLGLSSVALCVISYAIVKDAIKDAGCENSHDSIYTLWSCIQGLVAGGALYKAGQLTNKYVPFPSLTECWNKVKTMFCPSSGNDNPLLVTTPEANV